MILVIVGLALNEEDARKSRQLPALLLAEMSPTNTTTELWPSHCCSCLFHLASLMCVINSITELFGKAKLGACAEPLCVGAQRPAGGANARQASSTPTWLAGRLLHGSN